MTQKAVNTTGDGKSGASVVAQEFGGEVGSTPLQQSAKMPTTKTEQPMTPQEAVQIFQSGLNYLIKARFNVVGVNDGNQLIICIDNLQYETGRVFMVGDDKAE